MLVGKHHYKNVFTTLLMSREETHLATAKCVGMVTVRQVFTLFDNQGQSAIQFTIALSKNLRWPIAIL